MIEQEAPNAIQEVSPKPPVETIPLAPPPIVHSDRVTLPEETALYTDLIPEPVMVADIQKESSQIEPLNESYDASALQSTVELDKSLPLQREENPIELFEAGVVTMEPLISTEQGNESFEEPSFPLPPETAELLQAEPITALEELEMGFEPETVETYKELLELITDDRQASYSKSEIIMAEDFAPITVEFSEPTENLPIATENEVLTPQTVTFESFMAELHNDEEPLSVNMALQQAPKQPLEQTLVQFIEVLAATDEAEPAPEEVTSIKVALHEIAAVLPECYEATQTGEMVQITPEMTEKLLVLLEKFGYEQPKEALITLVQEHGLSFLYQAMWYLCHINDKDSQQEFLTVSALHNDTRLRLAKALATLISTLRPQPKQATTAQV